MTRMPFAATEYLPVLRELTAGFAQVLEKGDPEAPVPYCTGWTLTDLGTHLGHVHRWAAKVVVTGEAQPQNFSVEPGDDLAAWYSVSAGLLLDSLTSASADDPCWHFGGTGKTKAFWFRRQVHETAVHLIDAHNAAGTERASDPAVDADGVDEVFTVMLPKVTRWHPAPLLPVPLSLRASDSGDVWTIHPGEPPALGEDVEAAATVEAPARDLLRLLWKRGGIGETAPRISGDAGVAHAFLAAPMTP